MKERDVLRVTSEVKLTVPLVPPSVNHYKQPRRGGKGWYRVKAADDFMLLIAAEGRGKQVRAEQYGVGIEFFLGAKRRGDLDNFAKVVLDSLVAAKVIDSDAKVTYLRMEKARDRQNPRTEISVWAEAQ